MTEALKSKKLLITVGVALLVLVLVLFAVQAIGGVSGLGEQLSLGDKYLSALDYDNAILTFTKVLTIGPMNPRAYIGLADAYIGKGDIDKAIETLQTGYDKTGDSSIKKKLDELTGGGAEAEHEDSSVTASVQDDFFDNLITLARNEDSEGLIALAYETAWRQQCRDKVGERIQDTLQYDDGVEVTVYGAGKTYISPDGSCGIDVYFSEWEQDAPEMTWSIKINYFELAGGVKEGKRLRVTHEPSDPYTCNLEERILHSSYSGGVEQGPFVSNSNVIFKETGDQHLSIESGTAKNGYIDGELLKELTVIHPDGTVGGNGTIYRYDNGLVVPYRTEEHDGEQSVVIGLDVEMPDYSWNSISADYYEQTKQYKYTPDGHVEH